MVCLLHSFSLKFFGFLLESIVVHLSSVYEVRFMSLKTISLNSADLKAETSERRERASVPDKRRVISEDAIFNIFGVSDC